jgi:hypothetical protein
LRCRHLRRRRLGGPFLSAHGVEQVSPARKTVLLKTYWNIPDRQIETSVVLVNPPYQ